MKKIIFMFIALMLIQIAVGTDAPTNNTTIIICYSPYEKLVGEYISLSALGYTGYSGIVVDAIGSYIKTNTSHKYINMDKIGGFELNGGN